MPQSIRVKESLITRQNANTICLSRWTSKVQINEIQCFWLTRLQKWSWHREAPTNLSRLKLQWSARFRPPTHSTIQRGFQAKEAKILKEIRLDKSILKIKAFLTRRMTLWAIQSTTTTKEEFNWSDSATREMLPTMGTYMRNLVRPTRFNSSKWECKPTTPRTDSIPTTSRRGLRRVKYLLIITRLSYLQVHWCKEFLSWNNNWIASTCQSPTANTAKRSRPTRYNLKTTHKIRTKECSLWTIQTLWVLIWIEGLTQLPTLHSNSRHR